MSHTNLKSRKRTPIVFGIFLSCIAGLIWLTGCNPRGVPGSVLLTPGGLSASTATPAAEESLLPTQADEEITRMPSNTPRPTRTSPPTQSPTITTTPTISLTPTRTRFPTKTYPPTRTRRPSKTPTISLTPTPPWTFIRIAKPGPLSKIASPLNVQMGMTPGEDGMLYIDLIGEDGRFITRLTKDYRQYINQQIYSSQEIPFEIPGAAETVRLVMSAKDRFGRIMAQSTLDLVLIQMGDNITTPPGFQQEPYLIRNLKPESIVSGGNLHLEGVAHPMTSQPVIFTLVAENGAGLATKMVRVEPPTGPLSHTPFSLDIPYTVNAPTRVRLTMHQNSDGRIPGMIALSSILLQLNP